MFRIFSNFQNLFRILSNVQNLFRIFSNVQNLFRIFRHFSEYLAQKLVYSESLDFAPRHFSAHSYGGTIENQRSWILWFFNVEIKNFSLYTSWSRSLSLIKKQNLATWYIRNIYPFSYIIYINLRRKIMFRICSEFSVMFRIFRICSEF